MTSYIKVIIAIIGMGGIAVGASKPLITLMLLGYGIFCYVFGRAFVTYGWYERSIEIENTFNYFVREMRKKIR